MAEALSGDQDPVHTYIRHLYIAATASIEGKMTRNLKKLLKKVAHDELAVADAKLGSSIKVERYIHIDEECCNNCSSYRISLVLAV